MMSEANETPRPGSEPAVPEIYEHISREISRLWCPTGLLFSVVGEEALSVTLDVEAESGNPPPGFAVVCDGKAPGATTVLTRACFSAGELALSEEAALIVVDATPSPENTRRYEQVGAMVLSDARFASRQLARRATEAASALGLHSEPDPVSTGADVSDADDPKDPSDRAPEEGTTAEEGPVPPEPPTSAAAPSPDSPVEEPGRSQEQPPAEDRSAADGTDHTYTEIPVQDPADAPADAEPADASEDMPGEPPSGQLQRVPDKAAAPEPVRSEPARSEPARSEPARSEPVNSEPQPEPLAEAADNSEALAGGGCPGGRRHTSCRHTHRAERWGGCQTGRYGAVRYRGYPGRHPRR